MDALSKENQSANPKILASIESSIKTLYRGYINAKLYLIFKNFIYFYSLTMIIKGYSFILFTYIYKNSNQPIDLKQIIICKRSLK